MLTVDESKALESFKKEVLKRYSLIDFILYGSKALGNDTEESDIDIMIEIED